MIENYQEIISRFKKTRDLKPLYEEWMPTVYWYCFRILKNEQDAQDATQDTFVKMCRKIETFVPKTDDPKTDFKNWLIKIALNTSTDYLRIRIRRGRGEESIEDPIDTAGSDPDVLLERKELKQKLREAMSKLSSPQRKVIWLLYVEGWSYKEITKITGYTHNQIKSYRENGLKKLQRVLKGAI